jgi:low affinity Fe/Cu permease
MCGTSGFATGGNRGPASAAVARPLQCTTLPSGKEMLGMRDLFNSLAAKTAHLVGSYWAFLLALLIVIIWAATGPLFAYSDTWQLIINTGTTIVTFLMVFLIQNTQNRDAKALHLKLDELICSIRDAHNDMIDIEKLNDDQIEALAERYHHIREKAGVH